MSVDNAQNGESRVRKVLFSEMSIAAAIIIGTVSFIQFFNNPSLKNSEKISEIEARLDTFKTISDQINSLRDNHIHTLETKFDEQSKTVQDTQKEIIEIRTILDERLPRKK